MPHAIVGASTLRYLDLGTGDPIVFLHGLLQDSRVWAPLVDRLSSGHRCLVPDLPLGAHRIATGDATMEEVAHLVADFLDHLALGPVTLIGNDTGGALAQIIVARYADRIGRLVLTSCEAFDNVPPPIFRGLPIAARLGVLPLVLAPLKVRALRRLPIGFGWLTNGEIPHDLVDDWLAAYFGSRAVRRQTRSIVASLGNRRLLTDLVDDLARFDRPTLIAWAAEDRLFPVRHAAELGRLLPRATVEVIDGSRTWLMRDKPDRTAEVIRIFLRDN
jgi:pimeloyl-ACP methyl ester carboxylesterase